MGKESNTYHIHMNGRGTEHISVLDSNILIKSHFDEGTEAVIIEDPVFLHDQHWLVLEADSYLKVNQPAKCAVKTSFLREVLDWDSVTMNDDYVVVDEMEVSAFFGAVKSNIIYNSKHKRQNAFGEI